MDQHCSSSHSCHSAILSSHSRIVSFLYNFVENCKAHSSVCPKHLQFPMSLGFCLLFPNSLTPILSACYFFSLFKLKSLYFKRNFIKSTSGRDGNLLGLVINKNQQCKHIHLSLVELWILLIPVCLECHKVC